MSNPVFFPLLNPNEPDALLADLFVHEGQLVKIGSPLCSLETTKSTNEIVSEYEGIVIGIKYQAGDMVKAGDIFCYVSPDPLWRPADQTSKDLKIVFDPTESTVPEGLRITQPALHYARENNISMIGLPIGPLITLNYLLENFEKAGIVEPPHQSKDFDISTIIIYGGGGHGKSIIDLIRTAGKYKIIGIVDDNLQAGLDILGVPVLGNGNMLRDQIKHGNRQVINAVGGIGNINIRLKVFKKIREAGCICPTIIHPAAVIEPSSNIAEGCQIFPNAYVGSGAKIGYGTIINTSAIVSHDCIINDYVNLSPGSIIAGEVQIGSNTLVGMGTTVNLGVKIGQNVRIGNSTTIKTDVPDHMIIQAGSIWPKKG